MNIKFTPQPHIKFGFFLTIDNLYVFDTLNLKIISVLVCWSNKKVEYIGHSRRSLTYLVKKIEEYPQVDL